MTIVIVYGIDVAGRVTNIVSVPGFDPKNGPDRIAEHGMLSRSSQPQVLAAAMRESYRNSHVDAV